jgi:hypothetical protein
MADSGFQQTSLDVKCVQVLKDGKILNRWCLIGDIILVEEVPPGRIRTIMPAQDGLSEALAQRLINEGRVRRHQLKHGEKAISVKPPVPSRDPNETGNQIEDAMTRPQAKAEKAVMQRQKNAV